MVQLPLLWTPFHSAPGVTETSIYVARIRYYTQLIAGITKQWGCRRRIPRTRRLYTRSVCWLQSSSLGMSPFYTSLHLGRIWALLQGYGGEGVVTAGGREM
jgi:hypothetical protein